MKDDYTLSYILATYNKLPYLKTSLEDLLAHKKDDEEILVADGGSLDGTKEYLEGMYTKGALSYVISERDAGLAHALNKLAVRARGTLIKYVTDDDVYSYKELSACREFMLAHPEIDLVNTNGATKDQDPSHPPKALVYDAYFLQWMNEHRPFSFNDMGIMLRRSSLPITGLWNPGFASPDTEFSLRLSAGKANMAWYTGRAYVNISNPQSLSRVHQKRIKNDRDRLNKFYLDKNPDPYILERLKALRNKLRIGWGTKADRPQGEFIEDWPRLVQDAREWLAAQHKETPGQFLFKGHA